MSSGKIVYNHVKLRAHEEKTVNYFSALGFDIVLIPISSTPGVKTADFTMLGHNWEMKCPTKSHHKTIEHAFSVAVKQSPFVIFDLRRIKDGYTRETTIVLTRLFHTSKRIKQLKIITKDGKLLQWSK